jgi:hypothetical protein
MLGLGQPTATQPQLPTAPKRIQIHRRLGVNGLPVVGMPQPPAIQLQPVAAPTAAPSNNSNNWTTVAGRSRCQITEGGHNSGLGLISTGPPQGSISAHPPNLSQSYANAAAKQAPGKLLKQRQAAVQRLLAPVCEPLQFKVIRTMVNDSRPLRNLRGRPRDQMLKQVASEIGIGKIAALSSTIGNSILEFYVPTGTVEMAKTRLQARGMRILDDSFQPFALPPHSRQSAETCKASTVNRLAHLCLSARVVNLQDTILEGAPADIKMAVLEKVRMIKQNPQATLGRQFPAATIDMDEADVAHPC